MKKHVVQLLYLYIHHQMYGSVSNVVLVFTSPFETCTTTVLVLYIIKMKFVFISERNDVVSYQMGGWVGV